MKKIAFLIRDLKYGGAQRQLVTLAKALTKHGFDITVLYFYSNGPLVEALKTSGIRTICLEKQGRWHLLSFFRRLVHELSQIHPDILHGYLGESNLLTIFLKPFFPSTRMVWGLREANVGTNLYGWVGYLTFQMERLLSHFADLIIVNSHAGQGCYLSQGFPTETMLVIPNGIDTEQFKPDQKAGIKVRTALGISEDTFLIGLVGRLDPRKDHSIFLESAARLCEERQNVKFICVGTGPEDYRQELQQLTNELAISERVIWPGAYSDMSAMFNALDILVSASYTEGFSNVIAEAMACGVPCVVTNVGDSAWIVGDKGITVPPKDPEKLKIAIEELIKRFSSDDFDKLQVRKRIVEQFSVPQLVIKTEKAFLRLLHD